MTFCTVQDNVSFGADFRIGKSLDAWDGSYNRNNAGCTPADGCVSYDYAIADVTKKDVFAFFVRPPDNIRCDLKSDRLGDLEMQLRQPDGVSVPLSFYPPGSAAFTRAPGPVVAGGNNQTGFYYETGPDVMRVSDGALLRDFWSLEVSAREVVRRARAAASTEECAAPLEASRRPVLVAIVVFGHLIRAGRDHHPAASTS